VVEEFVQEVKDAIVQLMLEDQKMLEDQEAEADPDQDQETEIDAQDADKAVVAAKGIVLQLKRDRAGA
jgi:hypothetical protein